MAPAAGAAQPAGLARRFGAMLYDSLLVLALMFLGTLPFIAVRGGQPVAAGTLGHQLAMLAILWLFFAGFWAGAGRTLGMQSWGLRIEDLRGRKPGFGRASLRFVAAVLAWLPAGLGIWWQLLDRESRGWHDRLSGTRLRYYRKPG